jgi:hypothetical protein
MNYNSAYVPTIVDGIYHPINQAKNKKDYYSGSILPDSVYARYRARQKIPNKYSMAFQQPEQVPLGTPSIMSQFGRGAKHNDEGRPIKHKKLKQQPLQAFSGSVASTVDNNLIGHGKPKKKLVFKRK